MNRILSFIRQLILYEEARCIYGNFSIIDWINPIDLRMIRRRDAYIIAEYNTFATRRIVFVRG